MRLSLLLLLLNLAWFAPYNALAQDRERPELPNRLKAVRAGLPELDVEVALLDDSMIENISDSELWKELQQVAERAEAEDWTISVGLRRGKLRSTPLYFEFKESEPLAKLLTNDFVEFDGRKVGYSLVDYQVTTPYIEGEFGNVWRVDSRVNPGGLLPPDAVEPEEEDIVIYSQGCCGALTSMFSLTNRMGREIDVSDVASPKDVNGDGRSDGLFWNPEALKDLWEASGDTGGRAMGAEAIRNAHFSYNPTNAAPVSSATGQQEDTIFDGNENGYGTSDCESLAKIGRQLRQRLIEDQDVVIYIYFSTGGHVVPLISVDINEGDPCSLTLNVGRTSLQDGGRGFRNIPANPGITSYTVTNFGGELNTFVQNTDFPNKTVTGLTFGAFER